jgi:hypothetical protein
MPNGAIPIFVPPSVIEEAFAAARKIGAPVRLDPASLKACHAELLQRFEESKTKVEGATPFNTDEQPQPIAKQTAFVLANRFKDAFEEKALEVKFALSDGDEASSVAALRETAADFGSVMMGVDKEAIAAARLPAVAATLNDMEVLLVRIEACVADAGL